MAGNPSVLAIHLRDDGIMDGCNQYRFRIPFEEMRKRTRDGIYDWVPLTMAREMAAKPVGRKPTDYDMLLLPRHRPLPYGAKDTIGTSDIPDELWNGLEQHGMKVDKRSHLLDLVKIMGVKQKIVLEYDDDYFTESRDLSYEYTELLHELLQAVHAVTVSTRYLRNVVQKFSNGTPVYILPNCVNWGEWQGHHRKYRLPEGHIILGLTGSPTHYADWQVLEPVLPKVLEGHKGVSLMIGGFEPDYLEGLKSRFPGRVIYKKPVPYDKYIANIGMVDIVLCPVVPEDKFNLSKSGIKAIEGLASSRPLPNGTMGGAVPITSDLYYYRRVTGGNKRGLTIEHTEEAWYGAIEKLVTDEQLRMRMAKKGRSWVYNNRSIERRWHLWHDAYREIHRRKR